VYHDTALAALLHGAATWNICSVQAYVMQYLRSVMGISLRNKITSHGLCIKESWYTIFKIYTCSDELEMASTF